MRHVLALDAGTTGVTALVLDAGLRVRGRAYAETTQHFPRPGWVEQDAVEIHDTTLRVAREALRAARIAARDLAAVGITDQRETTVLWDRATGVPVHRAIVWQDRRTAARCHEMRPQWGERVRERTGLVLDPYFSATKLQWLLENVEGARPAAEAGRLCFGTIDSWLAWNLTGRHVTDVTNASRTLLWDLRVGAWDGELLEAFGVPEAVLPEVVPSSGTVGHLRDDLLGHAVPLAGLVGDQQAALFGQRCFEAGQAKNTYGTGCFLLQHTGDEAVRSRHGLLATRAAGLDHRPRFALEGSVFVAGAAVQWLRDGLGAVSEAAEVDRLAAEAGESGGVVVVPAFTGLGAPHWDPDARGAVLGITRGTGLGHIAYATLEAIAFQSTELAEAMAKDSGLPLPALRVDGGAVRSRPLLQMQADLLQAPVVVPENIETTALGSGMLAGLATDVWGLDDLKGPAEGDTVVEPRAPPEEARARLAVWREAVAAVRSFHPWTRI